MNNPFGWLKQRITPSYLGIDIGTTSIKIAELESGEQLPRLVNYGILESKVSLARANTVFQTSTLKLFEDDIVGALTTLLKSMRPRTRNAVASIPGFAAFTTVLEFPEMSPEELSRAVAFQAKQYVPLPISEVAIDWLPVGSYEDEKGFRHTQILLISVPLEHVKRYQRIFKAVGLSLSAIEIEALSLARSAIGTDPTPTLLVDIGSRATAITIVEKGQLRFTGQSDFAGASLTQALASSLAINPARAEELKRERGLQEVGPSRELSTIMGPFVDAILQEVKRVLASYAAQFPRAARIERVMLSGGGANLGGAERYFAEALGLPTVKVAPLTRCEYKPEMEPLVGELNPLLAVSLGLAIRELA